MADIKLTFTDLAYKVFQETKKPMTIDEVWQYAIEKGYDHQVGSNGKTPWATLGARIYVDIRDNSNSRFIKIDSKPKKFFLKELESTANIHKEEIDVLLPEVTSYKERDSHPFLAYFVNTYLNIYSKSIYHEKSSKKSYNQWLHPDIVGVNFPIDDWESEVLDLGFTLNGQLTKLYSFELKKELTFANLRESYFQAVSNSSWANEGYLVTAKLLNAEDFMAELKRLTSAFRIGIIKLDTDEPDNSEIIFPAKYNANIDWETVNKLSKENPDFRNFLVRIKNDLNSKEIRKEQFDEVLDIEVLKRKIKKGAS